MCSPAAARAHGAGVSRCSSAVRAGSPACVTQMHLEVCGALTDRKGDPPIAVFATSHGEIPTAEEMIEGIRQGIVSSRASRSACTTPRRGCTRSRLATTLRRTVTGKNAIAAGWLEAVLTTSPTSARCCSASPTSRCPTCSRPRGQYGVAAAFLLGPRAQARGRHARARNRARRRRRGRASTGARPRDR